MRSRSGSRLGAVALLAAASAVVLLMVSLLGPENLARASAVSGVGCFIVALATFVLQRADRRTPSIAKAREKLAEDLGAQWTEEATLWRLNDPHPLPVRWAVTRTAEAAMQRGDRETASDARASSKRLAGKFQKVLATYRKAHKHRLVILGPAGAGKSMLVIRLAQDLLTTREPGGRVPVIVLPAAGDPGKGLSSWIADQLARNHPELSCKAGRGTGKQPRLADELAKNAVLPILDGFDELPDRLWRKAFAAINADTSMPIIVTSRPKEFLAAVSKTGQTIAEADAVELLPLSIKEVTRYLGAATSALPHDRWGPVIEKLNANKKGPLASALRIPLMLWLARTIYAARTPDPGDLAEDPGDLEEDPGELAEDPGELANEQRFRDQQGIERYLLGRFVQAVYSQSRGRSGHSWAPEQAKRWLAFLAAGLDAGQRQDLEWWRLERATRGWRPVAFAIRAALVAGVALWLAWLLQRQHAWRYGAHSLPADVHELLLGGLVGRGIAPAVGYIASLFAGAAPGWARSSVDTLLARVPWHPPPFPVLVAWVALLAMGAGLVSAVYDTRRREKEPEALRRTGVGKIMSRAIIGVILWAIFFLVVLVGALALDSRPIPAGLAEFFHMPSAVLLLALCMLWTLVYALTPVPGPAQVHGAESPDRVLRLDQRASVVPAVVRRACVLALAWLCFGPFAAVAYGLYAMVRLLCQVFLGSARTASGRFAETRIWLAGGRRMPLRPMAFLADAHERGVLRRTGAAYQFRHLRLQQHLAAQHPRWSTRLASAAVGLARQLPARYPATVIRRWPPPDAPWAGPFWALSFEQAAVEASEGVEVGKPAGDVQRIGPGFAQEFSSAGQHPWMMCALPGHAPVLVARSVWDAAQQAVRASGDAFSALGLPAESIPGTPDRRRIVLADADSVRMAGGAWGPGVLIHDTTRGMWRWEAVESYQPQLSGDRAGSEGQRGHQSRILVVAKIPWEVLGLTIKEGTRQRFLDSLLDSPLAHAFAQLSALAEAGPGTASCQRAQTSEWRVKPRQVSNWAGYDCTALGTDGSRVATAEIGLSLQAAAQSTTVITKAELRIADLSSWRMAFPRSSGPCASGVRPRIPLEELLLFLGAAWQMVTEALPGIVVDDPVSVPPAGCPKVIWELWACGHGATTGDLCLHDVVDFPPFVGGKPGAPAPGRSSRAMTDATPADPRQSTRPRQPVRPRQPARARQLTSMGIEITGPLQHGQEALSRRSREALEQMAQWHGLGVPRGDGPAGPPAFTDGPG